MDHFDAAGIGREQFARRCNSRPYTREEWLAAERALTAALAEIARLTREVDDAVTYQQSRSVLKAESTTARLRGETARLRGAMEQAITRINVRYNSYGEWRHRVLTTMQTLRDALAAVPTEDVLTAEERAVVTQLRPILTNDLGAILDKYLPAAGPRDGASGGEQ